MAAKKFEPTEASKRNRQEFHDDGAGGRPWFFLMRMEKRRNPA
jgi:hypothetical protein